MRKRKTIIAMIPARMGSTRLPMKNLALLGGKPLIYYAIQAAKKAGIFDRIIVNSEDIIFSKIARRYGVEFYQRPRELGKSSAKSDFVVYDFVKNNPCDIVTWVNPISPLQPSCEVREAVDYFLKKRCDSLITVKNEQVHCLYKGRPVNFKAKEIFAQTQDITPVQPFVYSLMMWRTGTFIRAFEQNGYAFFCGRTSFYPASPLSGIIIKKREDLMLANCMMRVLSGEKKYKVRYDRSARKIKKKLKN